MVSPNFDSRSGADIDVLVLHYTGMRDADAAYARLCDPVAKVSAHYLVDEDGAVVPLVSESERAWHAGTGWWRGETNINRVSIGIEIVNPGHEHGYRPFPPRQMQAVIALCRDILSRHTIPARNVIGHSDLAPDRKEDPGELFDWEWLAREGIGLWPSTSGSNRPRMGADGMIDDTAGEQQIRAMQRALAEYGYKLAETGQYDTATRQVVVAFQRHFRPGLLSGLWDEDCAARLASLLASV